MKISGKLKPKVKKQLQEGIDFTIEPGTGLFVLTAAYLKERGYCCESGCRNCPYGFKKPERDSSPVSKKP